jgi:hypothetical protein
MSAHSDKELYDLIRAEGEDPEELLQGPQTDAAPERMKQGLGEKVSPSRIMGEVSAQGLTIPKALIGKFLICVMKGVWTKPLPVAVADCARSMVGGGGA